MTIRQAHPPIAHRDWPEAGEDTRYILDEQDHPCSPLEDALLTIGTFLLALAAPAALFFFWLMR